jgi:hypothetical protein
MDYKAPGNKQFCVSWGPMRNPYLGATISSISGKPIPDEQNIIFDFCHLQRLQVRAGHVQMPCRMQAVEVVYYYYEDAFDNIDDYRHGRL